MIHKSEICVPYPSDTQYRRYIVSDNQRIWFVQDTCQAGYAKYKTYLQIRSPKNIKLHNL